MQHACELGESSVLQSAEQIVRYCTQDIKVPMRLAIGTLREIHRMHSAQLLANAKHGGARSLATKIDQSTRHRPFYLRTTWTVLFRGGLDRLVRPFASSLCLMFYD